MIYYNVTSTDPSDDLVYTEDGHNKKNFHNPTVLAYMHDSITCLFRICLFRNINLLRLNSIPDM